MDAAAVGVVGHVGGDDDQLDGACGERAGEVADAAEPLGDRLRQAVVVGAEQRQPPERVRPERLVRLQAEHEVLQLVEPVERGHRAGERAGRRAVDPADPRPELGLTQPLEKAELHEDAVDGAAREHDRDIAFHPHIVGLCVR